MPTKKPGEGAAKAAPKKRKAKEVVDLNWQGKGFQRLYYFTQIMTSLSITSRDIEDDYFLQELLDEAEWIDRCFQSYIGHEVSTLDEAFEVARPKGYRRAAEKRRMHTRYPVRRDATALIRAGARVDTALFEALGQIHGIGTSTAAEYYYSFDYPTPQRDPNAKVEARLQKYLDELLR